MRFNISGEVASTSSIQKAVYRMAPLLFVEVVSVEDEFVMEASPIKDSEHELESLIREFKVHVNDYNLREQIAVETQVIKGLLYAQAFSKVGLKEDGL
jgi:His-Xaa-Ser system protein HxsD